MIIDAKGLRYKALNRLIEDAINNGTKKITIRNVNGQRYIGGGIKGDVEIEIYGTPGDVGYRVGIHMKEYKKNFPVIIAAGSAGDFLGEYMAGGRIVILGLKEGSSEIVGDWIATGIHGGMIYIRDKVEKHKLGVAAKIAEFSQEDRKYLRNLLKEFCETFSYDVEKILDAEFTKITPLTHRPYGKMYTE